MSFKGTVVIKKEDEWVVATCLENNIASQGKTIDEAIENLKEALPYTMKMKQKTN
jgi:predicted RNase H-like HicB family nuclease